VEDIMEMGPQNLNAKCRKAFNRGNIKVRAQDETVYIRIKSGLKRKKFNRHKDVEKISVGGRR
jgi:hypothetical protein